MNLTRLMITRPVKAGGNRLVKFCASLGNFPFKSGSLIRGKKRSKWAQKIVLAHTLGYVDTHEYAYTDGYAGVNQLLSIMKTRNKEAAAVVMVLTAVYAGVVGVVVAVVGCRGVG